MNCRINRNMVFVSIHQRVNKRTAGIIFLLLLFNGLSYAQPFTLNENIKPAELKLVNYNPANEMAKGMICVADVRQVKDTQYFFIKGFSIYSPSYAGITTNDSSGKINIGLYKETWRKADVAGITDSKGHWEKSFKTEGDYGIMVVPSSLPASYSLVIWTGKESYTDVPSVFKATGDNPADDNKSLFEKYSLPIIIGLSGLIVALLIFLLKKRKK